MARVPQQSYILTRGVEEALGGHRNRGGREKEVCGNTGEEEERVRNTLPRSAEARTVGQSNKNAHENTRTREKWELAALTQHWTCLLLP